MAIGCNFVVESDQEPEYSGFCPELWADEVMWSYKNHIRMMDLTPRPGKIYFVSGTGPANLGVIDAT